MDYEKKYNEALERVKKYYDVGSQPSHSDLEYIFPELRESEDEKIRTLLVTLVQWAKTSNQSALDPNTANKMLSYLEKQKKPNGEDEEFTDFTIYHPLKNGKGKYECIPYSFHGSLTSFSEDKDLIDFLRTCFYTKEECEEWIEKQKEQKPNIELIQRSWYMEGYHDREFGQEPKWILKTGEGGPKHELNPKYGQPLCGEQKPVAWSEEDRNRLEEAIGMIEANGTWVRSDDGVKQVSDFLKALPERFNFQPKQEWSEEDENELEIIIGLIEDDKADAVEKYPKCKALHSTYDRMLRFLKSLRPQPHWKPSEEQMKILQYLCEHSSHANPDVIPTLESLYNDLKKL